MHFTTATKKNKNILKHSAVIKKFIKYVNVSVGLNIPGLDAMYTHTSTT